MFWKKATTLEPDPPKPPEPKTKPIELWEAHVGYKMGQSSYYITSEDVEKIKAANKDEFVDIKPYIWRYGGDVLYKRIFSLGPRMKIKPERVVGFIEVVNGFVLDENQDVN